MTIKDQANKQLAHCLHYPNNKLQNKKYGNNNKKLLQMIKQGFTFALSNVTKDKLLKQISTFTAPQITTAALPILQVILQLRTLPTFSNYNNQILFKFQIH